MKLVFQLYAGMGQAGDTSQVQSGSENEDGVHSLAARIMPPNCLHHLDAVCVQPEPTRGLLLAVPGLLACLSTAVRSFRDSIAAAPAPEVCGRADTEPRSVAQVSGAPSLAKRTIPFQRSSPLAS